jgi:hypothetical protein
MAEKVTLEIVAGNPLVTGKKVTLSKGKTHGRLLFNVTFKVFKEFDVVGINWEENETRSAGKAAAGAIVGGLLTGGIGLLAGAAVGGRKKDKSTAVVVIEEAGRQFRLLLRCDPKEFNKLLSIYTI